MASVHHAYDPAHAFEQFLFLNALKSRHPQTRLHAESQSAGAAVREESQSDNLATQSATLPAIAAPVSNGIALPAYTSFWLREIVRFYRQRSRVVGVIASPLLFWVVIGSGFGTSFRSGDAAGQNNYLDLFLSRRTWS